MPPSSIRNPKSAFHNRALAPHAALVAVQLIFGTWPIVAKFALRALPSTGLVAFRVAGAAVALLVILRARGRLVVPSRADLARLALYSLLGVVLNQFLFVKGLALSTVVNSALLSTAIPVSALVVGAARLRKTHRALRARHGHRRRRSRLPHRPVPRRPLK
jgi:drug/metabolite transporter (DMT)-like permease